MSPFGVGIPVHYVARGSADGRFPSICRAAWVTEIDADDPDTVGVFVANPTGLFFYSLGDGGLPYDDGHPPDGSLGATCGDGMIYPGGTWHRPPGA